MYTNIYINNNDKIKKTLYFRPQPIDKEVFKYSMVTYTIVSKISIIVKYTHCFKDCHHSKVHTIVSNMSTKSCVKTENISHVTGSYCIIG